MIKCVEGIVLNEKEYGETSKILNVLTKEYGIIGIISKGCRTIKSSLRSVSTKLVYGNFNVYYKEGKLSTLISADVINNFKLIKTDFERISFATYILELTEQVVKENSSADIYDLCISSLLKIEEGFDPIVITNILELKYLKYLGVAPILDCCSVCGSTTSIATISSEKGGYVCKNCYSNETIVSEKTLKLIRMFNYVDISKISKIDIAYNEKKQIDNFLNQYYEQYTGIYLKTKKYIYDIQNQN